MPTFCQVCTRKDHHWFLSRLKYLLIPFFFTLTACGAGTVSQNSASIAPAITPPVTATRITIPTVADEVTPRTAVAPPAVVTVTTENTDAPVAIQPTPKVNLSSSSVSVQRPASFGPGLISLVECTTGLNGHLLTSRAGEIFLYDNGLSTEEPLRQAEAGLFSPIGLGLGSGVMNVAKAAPSAGTSGKTALATQSTAPKDGLTQFLLTQAYKQSGRPYKTDGQTPETGFDAAGYTRWVYAQKGVKLPRDVGAQAKSGRQVIQEELRPGDLLVYRDASKPDNEYHVGIYTGQGNFLHTTSKTGVVTETAAFGRQFAPYFVGGRRYFDDPEAAPLSDAQKMAATSSAVKLALAQLGPNDKLKRPKIKPRRSKPK